MNRLRLATFNVALARARPGALLDELRAGSDGAWDVANIIRHCQPDVLVLNEFDYDSEGRALRWFQRHYLESSDTTTPPRHYPHAFTAPVNTGVPSGHDLDGDGDANGPADALGFGQFPGQYGMAVLSRHAIDASDVRSFRHLPWRTLPGARLPRAAEGGDWYPPALLATLPVSSKSHWDVPIDIGGRTLHCLVSHPTPPVFDGAERRNYYRNRDELRVWLHYLDDDRRLRDDAGRYGGLDHAAYAAVLGDLNADPIDGLADHAVIRALIEHPRLQETAPRGMGGPIWHRRQRFAACGEPERFTGWFGAFGLRLDYVLPDRRLAVLDSGVFWPPPGSPHSTWLGTPERPRGSDHRLVWVDVAWPP